MAWGVAAFVVINPHIKEHKVNGELRCTPVEVARMLVYLLRFCWKLRGKSRQELLGSCKARGGENPAQREQAPPFAWEFPDQE